MNFPLFFFEVNCYDEYNLAVVLCVAVGFVFLCALFLRSSVFSCVVVVRAPFLLLISNLEFAALRLRFFLFKQPRINLIRVINCIYLKLIRS